MGRRAIFVDRDGTLCEDSRYLGDPERLVVPPRSIEAVRRANDAGFQVVVVTNQSGVARGLFTEDDVHEVHDRLRARLYEGGARLDGIYFCPHHPTEGDGAYRTACRCRKPGTGQLERARDEMGVDLKASFVIGDRASDIECGRRAGATTVLVRTGYGSDEPERGPDDPARPDHVADDLLDAVASLVDDVTGARR